MKTITIAVTIDGATETHEVTEAAYDLFLNAVEVGIEGAADGENDAHAEDASELWSAMREQYGYPLNETSGTSADYATPYDADYAGEEALLNTGA